MTLADAFSLRTKELMKKHGFTISELSRKSGIACSALYNILHGNISSPTISTLNKLSTSACMNLQLVNCFCRKIWTIQDLLNKIQQYASRFSGTAPFRFFPASVSKFF